MSRPSEDALQASLELITQGASLDECLARYPDYAGELEPLLAAAIKTRAKLTPGLSHSARGRIRAAVLAEWDHRPAPGRWRWRLPVLVPRWAAVAASVVVALMVSSTGTVLASSSSIPGDALYPVKQVREDVQLWLTRSPEAKVDLYTRLVKQRAEELKALALAGKGGPASIAAARLEKHVAGVNDLAARTLASDREAGVDIDPALAIKLSDSLKAQQSAAGEFQLLLSEAPAKAREGLERALQAIHQARDRVRAAQETIGGLPAP